MHSLYRTAHPGSPVSWLGHPVQHSSGFSLLLPTHPLSPLHFITFDPSGYRSKVLASPSAPSPSSLPIQLSAAHNLLITLHPSTSVSEHCAFPQFTLIFFLKLPLFPPYCLFTHFIILNLASISLSLPHPGRCENLPSSSFR